MVEKKPYTLRELFFQHVAQTSPSPLDIKVDKADGVFLYSDGKAYLDFVSGVSVSNVGHCHPEVVEAVREQAGNYFHTMVYGEMVQAPQVLHAQLLTSILPEQLQSVYYVNSGSEANEGALKLAKRITGRRELIGCYNAYHGSTHGALSLMGGEQFKTAFRPLLPEVRQIRFNNFDDLEKITSKTAAVLIEPVQGEGGVILPQDGYLQSLRERCDKMGAMLIFDEVQTGFGRTGEMFAFRKFGVVPDILTLAKALGGGMPLGAFISSKKNMETLMSNPPLGHITTFGGHPVCCAAALASLKILLRENWIQDVERRSKMVEDALKGNEKIKEIRRAGLLIAVDLGRADWASQMIPLLKDEGVISDYFMFHPTSFRIAPPLCISDSEIKMGTDAVLRAVGKLV